MTTKESIIFESLKLFSVNGYDAVSTRMIARAINASDAVIYKHFKSKQEILDSIIEVCIKRYYEITGSVKLETMHWKDVEEICLRMFDFQTQDEWIFPFRRLLMIEQFKNPQMAKLHHDIFIETPIANQAAMFDKLIKLGYMKEGNPRVYAMDLYGPFFLYHTVGNNSEELRQILKEHVSLFRRNVIKNPELLDQDLTGL